MVRRHWWIVALLTVVRGRRRVRVHRAAAARCTSRPPRCWCSRPAPGRTRTSPAGGPRARSTSTPRRSSSGRTAVAADAATLLRTDTAARRAGRQGLGRGAGEHQRPGDHVQGVRRPRPRRPARTRSPRRTCATARRPRRPTWPSRSPRIDGKLKQLNAALAPINARLATLRPDSTERPNLESQRSTITSQVNTLSARLNQLVTTTVSAGKIIRDANLPDRPSKPVLPLNLGCGAAIGLLLGAGAALLRERLDRRIRRPDDLTRRCDVAVLAALPPKVRPRLDDVFPPFGAGGRVFNRLRNEVVAGAPDGTRRAERAGCIVVAGASRGLGVDRGRGQPGGGVRPHRRADRARLRPPARQRRRTGAGDPAARRARRARPVRRARREGRRWAGRCSGRRASRGCR